MSIKKTLCMLSAIALMGSCFTACDKEESSSVSEADVISEESSDETTDDSSVGEICFMSDYDLNPVAGQNRSIALTLFEDVYGGSIKWIPTTRDTMYEDLSKAVLGGEQIDMFPYTDNALPWGVSQDLFQPLDDYIDLSAEMWSGVKGLADRMAYNGKHYAVPTAIGDTTLLIYDRKAVEDAGMDDPYKLYKDGKWTWDSFISMMKEYPETGCSGWIGKGIMQSTGESYVNYDGTAFTSNLDSEALAKAGEIQDQINGPMYDGQWYDTLDENILFLGMGSWAVPQCNEANKDGDVFFVPFPSEDGSGKFITADINSKMLVKGSDKGKAVAKYLECERLAETEEKYVAAQKKAAVENGMTEEQYDFLKELRNPDNVVFDFTYGMSKEVSNLASGYKTRGAVNNLNDGILLGFSDAPESWSGLRDKFKEVIEKDISNYK